MHHPASAAILSFCLALAVGGCVGGPAAETRSEAGDLAATCPAEAAAGLAALDAFMTGWNSKDEAKWEASLHFPHVRLAGGRTTVLSAPGGQRGIFEHMAKQGWDRSAWVSRELVQCGRDKAHFATVFVRYRADGSEISRFASLYIVENRGGRWAVSARSSFAG